MASIVYACRVKKSVKRKKGVKGVMWMDGIVEMWNG